MWVSLFFKGIATAHKFSFRILKIRTEIGFVNKKGVLE